MTQLRGKHLIAATAMLLTAFLASHLTTSVRAQSSSFSNASLNGRYGYNESGYTVAAGSPPTLTPFALAGTVTFNGQGMVLLNDAGNAGGSLTQHTNVMGNYNVNADGTGTVNWNDGNVAKSLSFVIVAHGTELRFTAADPNGGTIGSGTLVEQQDQSSSGGGGHQ